MRKTAASRRNRRLSPQRPAPQNYHTSGPGQSRPEVAFGTAVVKWIAALDRLSALTAAIDGVDAVARAAQARGGGLDELPRIEVDLPCGERRQLVSRDLGVQHRLEDIGKVLAVEPAN